MFRFGQRVRAAVGLSGVFVQEGDESISFSSCNLGQRMQPIVSVATGRQLNI